MKHSIYIYAEMKQILFGFLIAKLWVSSSKQTFLPLMCVFTCVAATLLVPQAGLSATQQCMAGLTQLSPQ